MELLSVWEIPEWKRRQERKLFMAFLVVENSCSCSFHFSLVAAAAAISLWTYFSLVSINLQQKKKHFKHIKRSLVNPFFTEDMCALICLFFFIFQLFQQQHKHVIWMELMCFKPRHENGCGWPSEGYSPTTFITKYYTRWVNSNEKPPLCLSQF